MKLFQCSIYEKGWMNDVLRQRDHVFAVDETDARKQICARWACRKNAKGLRIREIPITKTTRTVETYDSVEQGEYHYITRTYSQVCVKQKSYRCANCRHVVLPESTICNHCGAFFSDKV